MYIYIYAFKICFQINHVKTFNTLENVTCKEPWYCDVRKCYVCALCAFSTFKFLINTQKKSQYSYNFHSN